MKRKSANRGMICFLIIALIYTGCKPAPVIKHNGEKDLISFKSVEGVSYTEISRRQKNGLSFTEDGFQLEPQWKLKFVSDDSVSIYSFDKKAFLNFPLTRGYDSVFNTARTWLKLRKMSKDSLVFEVLKSQADSIDTRGAEVYMTFYANNYIQNVLHSDIATVRQSSRKDSLFISSLVSRANSDYKKAFAARQPVVLVSKSPSVKVNKWKAEGDILNNFDTSDDYFNPSYSITVNKADANFSYSFSVYVDDKGQMYYGKPLVAFTEQGYEDDYIHHSKAVMDKYLISNLQATPGKTLNMTHTSLINIHVEGKKS
ncbi:hypothetical protein [Mucilaginibacter sp. NFX135]|uniref:hypothetical protein n=1 Tax=Mucilaginibacter sp. NFX135 TaxID=3402687 RepID=UPI003AFAF1EB